MPRSPSFLRRTLTQTLCIYSSHGDFSFPAIKFWPHKHLWQRLRAGSDKSYFLSYVEIYVKLKGSDSVCQFEEKEKYQAYEYAHLKLFTWNQSNRPSVFHILMTTFMYVFCSRQRLREVQVLRPQRHGSYVVIFFVSPLTLDHIRDR